MEPKGITFDYDFGYSLPSYKEGGRKGGWKAKNRDQKSCLSAP